MTRILDYYTCRACVLIHGSPQQVEYVFRGNAPEVENEICGICGYEGRALKGYVKSTDLYIHGPKRI